MRFPVSASIGAICFVLFSALPLRAEQVVFSEIHYHTRGGAPEYLEVQNLTATVFDVALWKMTKGVDFEFPDFNAGDPEGTFLEPFERILISSVDEAALRAAYSIPASTKVFGPWIGNLNNSGETVELSDKNGVVRAAVSYSDDGRKWPVSADGAGHSLRLVRENRGASNWRNWGQSQSPGGTPGAPPASEAGQNTQIANLGSTWRYDQSGADLGTAWRELAYDDSSWPEGSGIFGKENASNPMPAPGFQTPWTNGGGKITYYLRKEFQWDTAFSSATIDIDGVFDDGVVVYLNGQEIGRQSMPAGAINYLTPGISNEVINQQTEPIAQGDISGQLQAGTNVLAVEVHNITDLSSDVLFGANVTIASIAPDLSDLLRISEVHFSAEGKVDWVEVHAPGQQAVSIAGFSVSSLRDDFSDAVPLSGTIPGGGYASVDVDFPLEPNGNLDLFVITGSTVVHSARFDRDLGEESFQSDPPGLEWFGGAGSTRDAPNVPVRNNDIVINEIMYDTPSDTRSGEFIELYNRGPDAVDLGGWSFVDGVSFDFQAGTMLASGAHLVVAADAAWITETYGGINVVGNFSGQLADSGELVRLEDAFGNLVDQVDYLSAGDWPDLADGDGSSMELRHPDMNNDSPSAWADSDESGSTSFQSFTYTQDFFQGPANIGNAGGTELQMHLVGDSYVIIKDIQIRLNGSGSNLLKNGTIKSPNGQSATGWLIQGTHWQSFVDNGDINLIADGHGDNKSNRAACDLNSGMSNGQSYTLTFDARWVYGKSRLIMQTYDHGFGTSFNIPIPNDLGTPGAANSTLLPSAAPVVTGVLHSPAVPEPGEQAKITARVESAAALSSVVVRHRESQVSGSNAWSSTTMNDNGTGGDVIAGDGIYTATLNQYTADNTIAEFYVEATATGGRVTMLPQFGPVRPAMFITDQREGLEPGDFLRERMIISQYDLQAMVVNNGASAAFDHDFPESSNHFFNATFIANEEEIFYNAEIRKSGSPFTRDSGNGLVHGKWKLPGDRLFRERRRSVFDPSGQSVTPRYYDDRIARQFMYLLGHPINEMEYVYFKVNERGWANRENHEPISNDFLDRNWVNGSEGTLLRIDDEWRQSDSSDPGGPRNADWSYKNSDNPIHYHTEWLMRTREQDYDYGNFVEFVRELNSGASEEELGRMADVDLLCINAAVRGYDGDWDTLTMDRGKNSYFYRPKGGGWLLVHWDGDRVFEGTNRGFIGGLAGISTYFNKPGHRRVINYYLTELITKYTRNSDQMQTWMDLEVDAWGVTTAGLQNQIQGEMNHYSNWFSGREGPAQNFIGSPRTTAFNISTSQSPTSNDSINLAGTAPSSVYDVRVVGQPDVTAFWTGTTGWELDGVQLVQGANTITVEGINHEGVIVTSDTFNVTKNGNADPVMVVSASPSSRNVALSELLVLDGTTSYDPEGDALIFGWLANPGADVTLLPAGATATASFATPGLYEIVTTGTDGSANSTDAVTEVGVFAGSGFSSFGGNFLESYWELQDIAVEDNTPMMAYYSLQTQSGALHIHIPPERPFNLGLAQNPLPPAQNYLDWDATWSYDDTNSDLGTAFADPAFDDSLWPTGPGLLGNDLNTNLVSPIATPMTKDASGDHITYYLRTEFEFDRDPVGSRIIMDVYADDGARLFLNGQELGRVRLPLGAIDSDTAATALQPEASTNDNAVEEGLIDLDGTAFLVEGTNVLAVDLHNASAFSSDYVFGATMDIASHLSGQGGSGIDSTIHPWIKRDLPADTDWVLQTDLSLYGTQTGEFATGLLVEVLRSGSRFRYGVAYQDGNEVAVVQVTPTGGVGTLASVPFSLSPSIVVRVRRVADDLIFEWRPDEDGTQFVEIHRIVLPAGSTALEGGPFAATEIAQPLDVMFDYVMLIDPNATSSAAGDLVLSEVMYKPDGGDLYEYLELYNAGTEAINLNGYRFPQGSPFDEFVFGDVTIQPGAYMLVVNDLTAFRSRYGVGLDPQIAGEWAGGSLSNSNEVITLLDADDLVVLSFEYFDVAPWPLEPDLNGNSLVLVDPLTGNTGNGVDYAASALVGGSPGSSDVAGAFTAWMAGRGEVDPLATKSGEPVNNLLTYAFGLDLANGDLQTAMPAPGVIEIGPDQFLTIEYRRRLGDPDIGYAVQMSNDGMAWAPADPDLIEVSVAPEGDGTERVTLRMSAAIVGAVDTLLRVLVSAP